MKKIIKTLSATLLIALTLISGISTVFAENIPESLKIKSHDISSEPIDFPGTFHVKETTGGKYVYCMTYSRTVPNTKITYSKSDKYNDAGVIYLLKEGSKAKNDRDYFAVQTALWMYLIDAGKMKESDNIHDFSVTLKGKKGDYADKIRNLVSNAKKASKEDNSEPTISLQGIANFKLNDDKTKYVSSDITVTSSQSDYNVELVEAPEGTTYTINNGTITIEIPKNSISYDITSFKVVATNSKTTTSAYKYEPDNSSYQVMAAIFEDTKSSKDELTINLREHKVSISKQDISNKEELPGAKLEVRDSQGNLVESWTSGTTPHEIDLDPGKYTLTEIQAPEGYIISKETIEFEVGDGISSEVVMYNEKKPEEAQEIAVPSTSSSKTIISSIFGMIVILFGSVLVAKKVKNNAR